MAELTTLARPYAKAAFEFARDTNALDRWSSMLATVSAVVQQPTVIKLLDSPNLTAEQKGQRLVELCGDSLDEKSANFVRYLAVNDRLELLPQVRVLFELLKANHEKTIDVEVATAFEMTEEQQNKLLNSLKAKLQREVNLQTVVDDTLIGGVLVRAGDLTIDGSVRGRLAKLAETMNV
ncbi:F0F1 ATP synthase subunit delta [Gilvimarinus sp. F26214L]|uniref:F0F1 ATP synthase subunit delta n=1 Tax=Gilvimarinus sp. DZF01 TaxID=3461371 RepID=UPI0040464AC8